RSAAGVPEAPHDPAAAPTSPEKATGEELEGVQPPFGASSASAADFHYLLGRTSQHQVKHSLRDEGCDANQQDPSRRRGRRQRKGADDEVVVPENFQPGDSVRVEKGGKQYEVSLSHAMKPGETLKIAVEKDSGVGGSLGTTASSAVRLVIPSTSSEASPSSLGVTTLGSTSLLPGPGVYAPLFASSPLPGAGAEIVHLSSTDAVLRWGNRVEWLHGTDTVERWLRSLERVPAVLQ
ncbi:Uap1, partial [Symbiodinium natans]